jgi:hypothetical protein
MKLSGFQSCLVDFGSTGAPNHAFFLLIVRLRNEKAVAHDGCARVGYSLQRRPFTTYRWIVAQPRRISGYQVMFDKIRVL